MAVVGRPKKGANKLPDWFNINKYVEAKHFSAKDWYIQLSFRRNTYYTIYALKNFDEIKDFVKFPNQSEAKTKATLELELAHSIRLLKLKPIIDLDSVREVTSFCHSGLSKHIDSQHHQPNRGIRNPTYGEIISYYNSFPEPQNSVLKATNKEIERVDKDSEMQRMLKGLPARRVRDFVESQVVEGAVVRGGLLKIDWRLPDEVLLEEFKIYLRKNRKNYGYEYNRPFVKNVDMKTWYNCGVLPYLDLEIVRHFSGGNIHTPSFIFALSSILDEPLGEDNFKKTTRVYADKLIRIESIRLLAAQAAREDAMLMPKSRKLQVRSFPNN